MAEVRRFDTLEKEVARLRRELDDLLGTALARFSGRTTAADHRSTLHQTFSASSTADLTLTTTTTDVPGASVAFTTQRSSAVAVYVATFHFNVTTAGAAFAFGRVDVDGGNQAERVVGDVGAAGRDTLTVGGTATLGAAGSHAIKLRADKSAAVGAVVAEAGDCVLALLLID